MDHDKLASELLRAIRGRRSQEVFSRKLGYRSNVAHTWETGRGFPTASKLFQCLARLGQDPRAALRNFYKRAPEQLDQIDLATAQGVSELLSNLRGRATLQRLAEDLGRDRFAVARWFKGHTEPRLPDFLRLIEACTLRLADFLACFADPEQLPELAEHWQALQAARRSACQNPWSHAVLRMLELDSYQELPKHEPGWFASRLHISQHEEQQCLDLLSQLGQVVWDGARYRIEQSLTVDTRFGDTARELATFWAKQGALRLEQHEAGNFAYNLFAVSRVDLERLRELQRTYFAQLRAIVAESQPAEEVAVVNMHLFPLVRRPEE